MKKKKTLSGTYLTWIRADRMRCFRLLDPEGRIVGFLNMKYRQMAMMFGSQETVHAVAYSYLNETLKTRGL